MADPSVDLQVTIHRSSASTAFGFGLCKLVTGEHVVTAVEESGAPASGQLRPGDEVVAVNGVGTQAMSHATVARMVCRRLDPVLSLHRSARGAPEASQIKKETASLGGPPGGGLGKQRSVAAAPSPSKASSARAKASNGASSPPPTPPTNNTTNNAGSTPLRLHNGRHTSSSVGHEAWPPPSSDPLPTTTTTNDDNNNNNINTNTNSRDSQKRRRSSNGTGSTSRRGSGVAAPVPPPEATRTVSSGRVFAITIPSTSAPLGCNVVGGANTYLGGLFVDNVQPNGAAAAAGVCVGDRILAVNGVGMLNKAHSDGIDLLRKTRGAGAALLVLRDPADATSYRDALTEAETLDKSAGSRRPSGLVLRPILLDLLAAATGAGAPSSATTPLQTSGPLLALNVSLDAARELTTVVARPQPSNGDAAPASTTARRAPAAAPLTSDALGGVFVQSPPAASGLEVGDRLLEVAGWSIFELDDDAVRHMVQTCDPQAGVDLVLQRLGPAQWAQLDPRVSKRASSLWATAPGIRATGGSSPTPSPPIASTTTAEQPPLRPASTASTGYLDIGPSPTRGPADAADPTDGSSTALAAPPLADVGPDAPESEEEEEEVIERASRVVVSLGLEDRKMLARADSAYGQLLVTAGALRTRDVQSGVGGKLGCSVCGGTDTFYGALFVEKITPGGAAAAAGLQPGDRLLAINAMGSLAMTHTEGIAALRATKDDDTTHLAFQRLGASAWLEIVAEYQGLARVPDGPKRPASQLFRPLELALTTAPSEGDAPTTTTGPLRLLEDVQIDRRGFAAALTTGGHKGAPLGGVFVEQAATTSVLNIGDRLLEANGKSLLHATDDGVLEELAKARGWTAATATTPVLVQRLGKAQWTTLLAAANRMNQRSESSTSWVNASDVALPPTEPGSPADAKSPPSAWQASAAPIKEEEEEEEEGGEELERRGEEEKGDAGSGAALPPVERAARRRSSHENVDATVFLTTDAASSAPSEATAATAPDPERGVARTVVLERQDDGLYGFSIIVPDQPGTGREEEGPDGVYVFKVEQPAYEGGLRRGDRVLRIGAEDMGDACFPQAMTALRSAGAEVSLVVSHEPEPASSLGQLSRRQAIGPSKALSYSCSAFSNTGFELIAATKQESYLFIAHIRPNGLGAFDQKRGLVNIGDQVLSINHTDTRRIVLGRAKELAGTPPRSGKVELVVRRHPKAWHTYVRSGWFALARTNASSSSLVEADRLHRDSQGELMTSGQVLTLVLKRRRSNKGLGCRITGGDASLFGGVFVDFVQPQSPADMAGLRPGDRILTVGRQSMVACSHDEAFAALQVADPTVKLSVMRLGGGQWQSLVDEVKERRTSREDAGAPQIERRRSRGMLLGRANASHKGDVCRIPVPAGATGREPIGLLLYGGADTFLGGTFVKSVVPESRADGLFFSGDRILAVNGTSTLELTQKATLALVKKNAAANLTLDVMRMEPEAWAELEARTEEATVARLSEQQQQPSPPKAAAGATRTLSRKREAGAPAVQPVQGAQGASRLRQTRLVRGLQGFGLQIATKEQPDGRQVTQISKLVAGGPAANSGALRGGDVILRINGLPTVGAAHDEAVDVISHAHSIDLVVVTPNDNGTYADELALLDDSADIRAGATSSPGTLQTREAPPAAAASTAAREIRPAEPRVEAHKLASLRQRAPEPVVAAGAKQDEKTRQQRAPSPGQITTTEGPTTTAAAVATPQPDAAVAGEEEEDPEATTGEVVAITVLKTTELGFSLIGGRDHPLGGLHISALVEDSRAELAGLEVGDRLLELDGQGMMRLDLVEADRMLSLTGRSVHLLVQRLGKAAWRALLMSCGDEPETIPYLRPISLDLMNLKGPRLRVRGTPLLIQQAKQGHRLGFSVAGGIENELGGPFVTGRREQCAPGVFVGDRILEVDGHGLIAATQKDVTRTLRGGGDPVALLVLRMPNSQWQAVLQHRKLVKTSRQAGVEASPSTSSARPSPLGLPLSPPLSPLLSDPASPADLGAASPVGTHPWSVGEAEADISPLAPQTRGRPSVNFRRLDGGSPGPQREIPEEAVVPGSAHRGGGARVGSLGERDASQLMTRRLTRNPSSGRLGVQFLRDRQGRSPGLYIKSATNASARDFRPGSRVVSVNGRLVHDSSYEEVAQLLGDEPGAVTITTRSTEADTLAYRDLCRDTAVAQPAWGEQGGAGLLSSQPQSPPGSPAATSSESLQTHTLQRNQAGKLGVVFVGDQFGIYPGLYVNRVTNPGALDLKPGSRVVRLNGEPVLHNKYRDLARVLRSLSGPTAITTRRTSDDLQVYKDLLRQSNKRPSPASEAWGDSRAETKRETSPAAPAAAAAAVVGGTPATAAAGRWAQRGSRGRTVSSTVVVPRVDGKLGLECIGHPHATVAGTYIKAVSNPQVVAADLPEGSRLLKINGEDIEHRPFREAHRILRDAPGQSVMLTVRRSDEDLETFNVLTGASARATRHWGEVRNVARANQAFGRARRGSTASRAESPRTPQQRRTRPSLASILTLGLLSPSSKAGTAGRGSPLQEAGVFSQQAVHLAKPPGGSFGFVVAGEEAFAAPLFISDVVEGSPACDSDQLEVGDRILAINGRDTTSVLQTEALQMIADGGPEVALVVAKDRSTWRTFRQQVDAVLTVRTAASRFRRASSWSVVGDGETEATLPRNVDPGVLGRVISVRVARARGKLGFGVMGGCETEEGGLFVNTVSSSIDCHGGELKPGDRLLQINDLDMTIGTHSECINLLQHSGPNCRLTVLRIPGLALPSYHNEPTLEFDIGRAGALKHSRLRLGGKGGDAGASTSSTSTVGAGYAFKVVAGAGVFVSACPPRSKIMPTDRVLSINHHLVATLDRPGDLEKFLADLEGDSNHNASIDFLRMPPDWVATVRDSGLVAVPNVVSGAAAVAAAPSPRALGNVAEEAGEGEEEEDVPPPSARQWARSARSSRARGDRVEEGEEEDVPPPQAREWARRSSKPNATSASTSASAPASTPAAALARGAVLGPGRGLLVVEVRKKRESDSFGFTIAGDRSQLRSQLRVSVVKPGSLGERAGLLPGDQIMSINGGSTALSNHAEAKDLLDRSPLVATLELLRPTNPGTRVAAAAAGGASSRLMALQVRKAEASDSFGFAISGDHSQLRSQLRVGSVRPGSAGERAGLQAGDVLMSINGGSTALSNHAEAKALLDRSPLVADLEVVRQQ